MGVFQDKVKAHMEEYNGQNNELVDKKGGAWKGKGSFAHILRDSQNDWMFNLLLPYREVGSLVQDIRKGVIKKHMYAHHLNSSQMMCMNFFYPLPHGHDGAGIGHDERVHTAAPGKAPKKPAKTTVLPIALMMQQKH